MQQVLYIPSVGFSWLLFDLGGRAGTIGAAREALLAADWTHNAVIADVVLRTAQAYYAMSVTARCSRPRKRRSRNRR